MPGPYIILMLMLNETYSFYNSLTKYNCVKTSGFFLLLSIYFRKGGMEMRKTKTTNKSRL